MNSGRAGASQQQQQEQQVMENMMRGAASGFGGQAGAQAAQEALRQQAEYIDPPMPGQSTPPIKTLDQYWRLHGYDGWDGDMRWPHPQFTKDEAERAKHYNNRPNVGYMRDQAQITAYERQMAENQAAMRQMNSQGSQPQGGPRPGLPPMRDVFGRR